MDIAGRIAAVQIMKLCCKKKRLLRTMECRVCEFTVPQFGIKKMHGGPDMDEFIVCLKG